VAVLLFLLQTGMEILPFPRLKHRVVSDVIVSQGSGIESGSQTGKWLTLRQFIIAKHTRIKLQRFGLYAKR
jgi:predicted choloylglycine hydrolase